MSLPFYKGFVDLTKDGTQFLYSSNHSGKPQLYLKTVDPNSIPKQITFGDLHVKMGYFSPNEECIAFQAEDSGNEQYHMYLLNLKEEDELEKQISKTPYFSDTFSWNPNGKEMARTVGLLGALEKTGIEIFNIETGEYLFQKISNPVGDVQFSPDGKWLAYTFSTAGGKGTEIRVQNKNDADDIIIYSFGDTTSEMQPIWSPDGKKIAFASNQGGKWQILVQEFRGSELVHLNLNEGEEVVTNLSGTSDFKHCWHPHGQKVYYIYTIHSRTYIRGHYLNNEKEKPLPFPNGENGPFKISGDGKIVVSYHSSMTDPSGIFAHKIGSDDSFRITPKDHDDSLIDALSKPESIWYESFDKLKIHGWYLKGIYASKESPVPAILYIHGGPGDQVFDEWAQGVYLQAFSQLGYSIFAINYRGSTGYGGEFYNSNREDYGGGDLEDCVYAAKWLRTRPEVDPEKIAIAGGSYGGFMTLIALTKKPEIFTAGVSLVPAVDWIETFKMFGEHYTEAFGGTPDEKRELYVERSPLTHVKQIKSPVLIIAGATDVRCPIEPIRKFVKELEIMNHPHTYIERGQDGHTSMLESASDRIRDFRAILKFLKKSLKK